MDGVISSFLNKLAEARDAEAAANAAAADAQRLLGERDAALAALREGSGAEAVQLREELAAARADLEVRLCALSPPRTPPSLTHRAALAPPVAGGDEARGGRRGAPGRPVLRARVAGGTALVLLSTPLPPPHQ